jgi:uncharacterized protein YkwD
LRPRAGLVLVGLLLAVLLPAGPAEPEESALDKKARRDLAGIALALARKGQGEASKEIVEVLRSLGTPADEVGKVEKKTAEQLARAKSRRDARAEGKKLAKLAGKLAETLGSFEGERLRHVARTVLRLDSELTAARDALGHVRHEGRWLPAALVPLFRRRAEVEALVRKWRKATFEIEVGASTEPGLAKAYGGKAAVARYQGVEVHVARTGAAGARRVLLQTLRAWYLAAELAGVSPKLDPANPTLVVFHATTSGYKRSIADAAAAGRLPASEVQLAHDNRTYRTKDGYLVSDKGIEAHHQTFVLFDVWFVHARLHWNNAQPLPCLEAGFLNWVMLQVMGCPLPRINWRETEWERRLGSTLTEEENRVRRHLWKLSRAGLAGTRAYMRFLVERRLDPPWSNAFVDALGRIRGHDLLKCTHVVEYLVETGELQRCFADTVTADASSVPATTAAIEKVLGRPLSRLEADLREWTLHRSAPGVVQRLAAPVAPEGESADAVAVTILNALRRRAFDRSNVVTLEPDLSAGARAHAAYLARHPEQAAAWPAAHEEYVDHEGYSPEGARAGASSVIAPGCSTWRRAIDAWMGTYFHRLPLLDPGLLGIGAGLEQDMAVLDSGSLVDEWATRAYVTWPPNKAKGVPLRFEPELPNPVPGQSQATMGYPVTLQVTVDGGQPGIVMRLTKGGAEVPCWFTAPHAPLNPELVPAGAYCLIPKAPLAPNSEYTVHAEKLVEETAAGTVIPRNLTWRFRTGP